MEKKHQEDMEKQKLESSQREARLVADNDLLNEAVSCKEKEIARLSENINESTKILAEKDKIIDELNQR